MGESSANDSETSKIDEEAKESESIPEDDKKNELFRDLESLLTKVLDEGVARQFEAHWPSLVSSLSPANPDPERRRVRNSDVSNFVLHGY